MRATKSARTNHPAAVDRMLRRKRTAYDAETAVSEARAALRQARFLRGGFGVAVSALSGSGERFMILTSRPAARSSMTAPTYISIPRCGKRDGESIVRWCRRYLWIGRRDKTGGCESLQAFFRSPVYVCPDDGELCTGLVAIERRHVCDPETRFRSSAAASTTTDTLLEQS
jgi:hypothetical protein